MEEHRKDEHGYLCTICQSKLGEWADLKNHMLIEHGGYLSSEFNSGSKVSSRIINKGARKYIFCVYLVWGMDVLVPFAFHRIFAFFGVSVLVFRLSAF